MTGDDGRSIRPMTVARLRRLMTQPTDNPVAETWRTVAALVRLRRLMREEEES